MALPVFAIMLCGAPSQLQAKDLNEAVKMAVEFHPSVGAAKANEDAVKFQKLETFAGFLPDININAAGGRLYADNSTSRGSVTTRGSAYSNLMEGGVSLTQPIFSGFETLNRSRAASHDIGVAHYNLIDVKGNLVFRTVIAYLDVIRSVELLNEISMYELRLAGYIEKIKILVDEGAADQSVLTRAIDLKAEVRNTSAEIRSSLRIAQAEYQELVGEKANLAAMSLPYPPLNFVPSRLEDAVQFAKSNHPFLKSSELQQESLRDSAEADKQYYYPDISGELSYFERDQEEDIGGELTDARAVLRLNWDISVGGSNSSRFMQSKHRHLEAKQQLKESQRQIERLVNVAYSDMIKSQEQLAVQNERKAIAQELYQNYKNQFEGARVDIFQVIQADNDLYNSSLAALNTKYSLIVTQYGVLASIGRLQEALGVLEAEHTKE